MEIREKNLSEQNLLTIENILKYYANTEMKCKNRHNDICIFHNNKKRKRFA